MSDILDPKRQEKDKKKQNSKRKKELSDWRKVLSLPEGRRIVWRLFGISGLYRDPMTGNSQTFYNIGAQKIGRWIQDEIFEANNQMFAQIQSEAISAVKSQEEEQDE